MITMLSGIKKISPGSKTEALIYCHTPRSGNKYNAKVDTEKNTEL